MFKINIIFLILFSIYSILSKFVFDKVYSTSEVVIDEFFHIPQGLQYCKLNFSTWDPKITTLPGLYIISTLLNSPFAACTAYWLRFTSLICSILNVYLLLKILQDEKNCNTKTDFTSWKTLISSVNISILPPFYFFSHLYYTDVVSVTSVYCMFLFSKRNRHTKAAFAGLISIIIRQTNVIWLGLLAGKFLLDLIVTKCVWKIQPSPKQRKALSKQEEIVLSFSDCKDAVSSIFNKKIGFQFITKQDYVSVMSYSVVFLCFVTFVLINGGLVVGDKKAHAASLHIPQLFYFSLFYFIFALPFCLTKIKRFFVYAFKHKFLTSVILVICLVVVHFNTLVHPYLLADNRHYTFYIWNRFYGKYYLARYLIIPIYIFSLFCILSDLIDNNSFTFAVTFLPCLIVSLILQKMLEVRYFLIPFLIIRFKMKDNNVHFWQLLLENTLYFVINAITFNIFFTKEIVWNDFPDIQRLIW